MTLVVTGVVMLTEDSSHSNAPGEKEEVGIFQLEDGKGKDGKVTSSLTLRYVRNTFACTV